MASYTSDVLSVHSRICDWSVLDIGTWVMPSRPRKHGLVLISCIGSYIWGSRKLLGTGALMSELRWKNWVDMHSIDGIEVLWKLLLSGNVIKVRGILQAMHISWLSCFRLGGLWPMSPNLFVTTHTRIHNLNHIDIFVVVPHPLLHQESIPEQRIAMRFPAAIKLRTGKDETYTGNRWA